MNLSCETFNERSNKKYISAMFCHNSDEYQKSWNIAKNSTKRNLQIVEGLNIE